MRNALKDIFLFILVLPVFMIAAEMMYSHTTVKDYSSPLLSSICMKLNGDTNPEIRFGNLFIKAISIEKSFEDSTNTLIKTVRNMGQEAKNPLTPMQSTETL